MSTANVMSQRSFVVCQAGKHRFALPAEIVVELAPPVRLHTFAHTTPHIVGVIIRRGCIVPIHDTLSPMKMHSSAHRCYLIAKRADGGMDELSAIPVDGECKMTAGEMRPPESGRPNYVSGSIIVDSESLDVLDFDALVALRSPIRGAGASQTQSGGPL